MSLGVNIVEIKIKRGEPFAVPAAPNTPPSHPMGEIIPTIITTRQLSVGYLQKYDSRLVLEQYLNGLIKKIKDDELYMGIFTDNLLIRSITESKIAVEELPKIGPIFEYSRNSLASTPLSRA